MRLYIVRHADPDYPNDTITPAGHTEAAALARRLATYNLTHLYQSPLGRARATAKYTADAVNLPVTTLDWTCEVGDCFYHHETHGRLGAWDTPGEVLRDTPPCRTLDDWHRIDDTTARTLKHKHAGVAAASDAFLATHGYQRVRGRYRPTTNPPPHDQVAVFCHGGLALFWLSHLLEIPLPLVFAGFWHAPTAVTTILLEERSNQFAVPRALAVADTSHLYANNLPIQPRGILGNYD
jgi:broad specificity phosphatase PhoE